MSEYVILTSKLGVHVDSIIKQDANEATHAARDAIASGIADSAAIYITGRPDPIAYFGSGR